ncbi:PREDICTED: nidogen-2-like [Ficedula albicollis]|uniref:nidogen-2-like n=1 Tax=Ficedula albicollis TaxID=59894 RepID=UPI0007AD8927|nr:PREDICTED: nidogen-2-like [Ficedula albicollis]
MDNGSPGVIPRCGQRRSGWSGRKGLCGVLRRCLSRRCPAFGEQRRKRLNLYWTDWNREAPKIETSTVNGDNRRVLVHTDIGLPNGLTFDPFSKLLCWADAGTKHLECTFPDGSGRRVIQSNLNYPFSIVSYANHFYHTDWRRDGVIAVNKETGSFTDEYLPEQRSHLYGITAVYPYCPGARK